jgi:hypothetical protein
MLLAHTRAYLTREEVTELLARLWAPEAQSFDTLGVYWPTLLVAAAVAAWPGGRSDRDAGVVLLVWAFQAHRRLFVSWFWNMATPVQVWHDLSLALFALCLTGALLGVLCWWRKRTLRLSAWTLVAVGTVLVDYFLLILLGAPWETFR